MCIRDRFKGLTAEAAYNFPLANGQVDLNGSFFYLDEFRQSNNGVTVTDFRGQLGYPKYSGQINAAYTNGNYGIDFQANYQGKQVLDNTFTVESRDILGVGDYWLFNLTGTVRIAERSKFMVTVSNLFDRDAPFPLTTNGLGIYDLSLIHI